VEVPAVGVGLSNTSFAICHQITTLDRAKLANRVGSLSMAQLIAVENGIRAALDMD
jgi:mRNA-degrading endonuclease toxin of MazEF toxin-antitoxin module